MSKTVIPQTLFNIIFQPSLFILTLMLSIALGSCASQATGQTSENSEPALPLLQFQKTPCYGPCPAYEATIMEDGSITFIAWGNVPIADNDTVKLSFSKQELHQLKTAIDELNYTSLQDAYLTEWTDRPTSYLTFYKDGKSVKRIKHQEGGPGNLITFQKNLHSQLMDLVAKEAKKD